MTLHSARKGLPLALALALGACGSSGGDNGDTGENPAADAGVEEERDEWDDRLDEREVDYNAALRIAALRLTGELPTLAEVKALSQAGDLSAQKTVYESLVQSYIDSPLFARQVFRFYRDTFKMGGTAELDTAPAFAAQLVVEGRNFNELFTATAGTCPTFDPATNTFTPADCTNGVPTHAGVLTNGAAMSHYFSNLAFRRVRWVQETFDCTAFPAEIGEPQDVGGSSVYNGVWPFESISGAANGGSIDFLDVSAVTCANCHQTMNHIAPLFAYFDEDGMWQTEISVPLPTDGAPPATLTDWLPAGETTAWRYGVAAADLPALGQAMAADAEVAECSVARIWNWALGKGDIVDTLSVIPSDVIADQVSQFASSDYNMRTTIFNVFTSEDFVRF